VSRGGDREGGAVLVEFAFLLPLLALMAFGVMEFGLALQDRMAVQTATRTGARVGSAAGNTVEADRSLLLGVGSGLNDIGLANVEWVLVYRSSTADGAVPAGCMDPPRSASGSCNAYTGAQLQQLVAGTSPSSWFGCGDGALDASWCPAGRQTIQSYGADHLGVWIRARRPMLTGFFGSALTITDRGVMRLEPRGA